MKIPAEFQHIGADFLAGGFHRGLGDEPGLGKSLQAILAAQRANCKSGLISCPASVRSHWWEEIEEFFGHTRGWDVISYDGARIESHRAHLRDRYDAFVPDEVHFCKECDSLRTRAIFGKGGLARRATYVWPLSGTMAPNGRPLELYPMLKSLHPKFAEMNFAKYAQLYCGMHFDGQEMNVKGASRVEEFAALLAEFCLRRTKREVFPDRREPLVDRVGLDLTGAELRAVQAYEDEIGGREARLSSSFEKFSQMGDSARLQRLLGVAMAPHVAGFVSDKLATVDKVVVFYRHTEVAQKILAALGDAGFGCTVYAGGMTDVQKSAAVRRFQEKGCQVLVGQWQAAGTGINGLQSVCSTMVFAEPDWVPGDTEQRISRLDRMGQQDDIVNAYVLYARQTLQAIVVKVHDGKESRRAKLFDAEAWKRSALGSLW